MLKEWGRKVTIMELESHADLNEYSERFCNIPWKICIVSSDEGGIYKWDKIPVHTSYPLLHDFFLFIVFEAVNKKKKVFLWGKKKKDHGIHLFSAFSLLESQFHGTLEIIPGFSVFQKSEWNLLACWDSEEPKREADKILKTQMGTPRARCSVCSCPLLIWNTALQNLIFMNCMEARIYRKAF